MNTTPILISGWTFNPVVLVAGFGAAAIYLVEFGAGRRFWWMAAAVITAFLALLSPVDALARGYLFSAHMLQHTMLLLAAPAFFILSLPRDIRLPRPLARLLGHPLPCWLAGMGSMYIWHIPALCDAATIYRPVFAFETVTLLALGSAFWWQIIAPSEQSRLSPPAAIIYLFGTCMACSALGMIVTFSPISVCPVFLRPTGNPALLQTIRSDWGMTSDKDQQAGGLLMWVPLCMVYLGAIFWQIARWFAPADEPHAPLRGGLK